MSGSNSTKNLLTSFKYLLENSDQNIIGSRPTQQDVNAVSLLIATFKLYDRMNFRTAPQKLRIFVAPRNELH